MDRPSREEALNAAVSAKLAEFSAQPAEQLIRLGFDAPRTEVVVDGCAYDVDVWSEPVRHDADGLCVVIARLIERRIIGSTHYVRGFVLSKDGQHVPMTERELWQYD